MIIKNTFDENNNEITILYTIHNTPQKTILKIYDSLKRYFYKYIDNLEEFMDNYNINDLNIYYKYTDNGLIVIYLSVHDYNNNIHHVKQSNYTIEKLSNKLCKYYKMLTIINHQEQHKIIKLINHTKNEKKELLRRCPSLDKTYHVHSISTTYGLYHTCTTCNTKWSCPLCKYYTNSLNHKCIFCKRIIKK
jgi:hypothetical protein